MTYAAIRFADAGERGGLGCRLRRKDRVNGAFRFVFITCFSGCG